MERQRSLAIESLEISGNYVKCQRCGVAVPIVGKLTKVSSDRVAILQNRIKWIEEYYYYYHHHHRGKDEDIKVLKGELAELLEEDAKYDKLSSLPLYNCRITDWKSYVLGVMIRCTHYYRDIDH
jgi:hypothetical protein